MSFIKKKNTRPCYLFFSFVFLLSVLFPSTVFSKTGSESDAWRSIEQGLLQVYKHYDPGNPILKGESFSLTISAYLNAGLWSSAEALLNTSVDPSVKQLRLELKLRRGKFTEIYASYQEAQDLFSGQPELILAAAQGALAHRDFEEALKLLDDSDTAEASVPKQLYLTALAHWGLKNTRQLQQTFDKAERWSLDHEDSSWAGRLHLLKVYFHLGQKEYERAFEGIGAVFADNSDLALLALTWGYFKLGSSENLFSILQAFDEDDQKSPYYSRVYRILSRFLIEKGNLRGAIEMDQKERDELKLRMVRLEEETEALRKGITSSSLDYPPGSLLSDSLLNLKMKVGSRREITTLLWYIDLEQRKQTLKRLKARERTIEKEQRKLQMEMIRRCMSVRQLDFKQARPEFKSSDMTEAYRLARLAANEGKVMRVVEQLRKIISLQSKGPHAEESRFRLANLAFNAENYSEAIKHYQSIVNVANSPLYRAALYKLAWAYYLNGEAEVAVRLLVKQEIDLGDPEEDVGPCVILRTPQEQREPFRLLAFSLKALGGPGQLTRLVNDRQPKRSFPFITEVTRYYESEKRLREMFELIGSWIASHPLYVETPFLHDKMVSYIKQSVQFSTEDVLEARSIFVRTYGPGSAWSAENRSESSDAVRPLLKNHLQFLMTHYYAEGKKTGKISDYALALPWYRRYLALFSADKDTGRIRYLYADLLLSMNEEQAAMAAYQKSAYNDSPHERSSEAGYREILLLEKNHAPSDPEIEQGYDRFVRNFPEDHRSDEISMRLAEMAFQEKDYAKSRHYATRFLSRIAAPQTAFRGAEVAANRLIVQAYLKERAYPGAIHFLEGLIAKISNEEALKEFKSLLALSFFQHGEALKLRGKAAPAAEAFFGAYGQSAKTEMGPLALFEAAVLWDRPETRQKAEEALHLFYVRYPASSLYHPALIRLAVLYQETRRPMKGAEIFEEASRLPVSDELSHQALDHAIALYEAAGHWKKVFMLVMERAGQSPDREKEGVWMVKAAEIQFKLGEENKAKNILIELIESASEAEADTEYIAKAYFLLAETKISGFSEIKLVAPLDLNLQRKSGLFEDLLNAYNHAMTHPSSKVTINANHRIGEIFEEFSRALLYSERPLGLSIEETSVYDDLLHEQARPYIEQAEEAYLENIEFGKSMNIDNEWTRKSAVRLKRIYEELDLIDRDGDFFS